MSYRHECDSGNIRVDAASVLAGVQVVGRFGRTIDDMSSHRPLQASADTSRAGGVGEYQVGATRCRPPRSSVSMYKAGSHEAANASRRRNALQIKLHHLNLSPTNVAAMDEFYRAVPHQARDLLAPVYGWFTEGFDTLDLKEAKTSLNELHA